MAATITREVLESYLKCRYKAHLQLTGQQGSKSDYELLLGESRDRVRRDAAAKLVARHEADEVLRGLVTTPAVLERGVPLLLNATLQAEGVAICFDGLQKVAGPSSLGDFHYIPVLFHEAERPTPEHKTLLELHGLILAALQGREPSRGLLIHGRDCEERWVRLNPERNQTRRLWEENRELQKTSTPPRQALNRHCQVCEFRERCLADATARDDLSLLRGMSEKEIRKCARRGIFTVTQLSCTFRPRKKHKRSKQKGQPHQHALQALAVRDKKVYILGTPELPAGTARIYFDLEGDPERGFVYLLGVIVEANGTEERYSFWADTPDEEPRLFQQFLDVVSRHEDFWLYSYGSYEAAFLRRMLAKGVGGQGHGESLLSRLVNVLSVVHSHVYFPTYSNGLKDIGGYLGFRWAAAEASGIQSLVWRRRWEQTGSAAFKETLVAYNLEDCAALRRVTQFLYAVCPTQLASGGAEPLSPEGYPVSRVEEAAPQFSRREWCVANFALPDFEFVNERAYFDYQRDRVFIRTSPTLRRSQARERRTKRRKTLRTNRCVEISSQACPSCGGTELTRREDGRLARLAFDLRVSRGGVRRWVTRFTTSRHHCAGCGKRFLPRDYLHLEEYFHSLQSWAMYKYVAHRASLASITEEIRDCFSLPLATPNVHAFKARLACYYEETYKRLLEKIVSGSLIHADETEVRLKQVGKGYVWVFTSLEEVVFMYRQSREGTFLLDLLKGFRGVLVSDFYAPYDSLACEQQKCLVHLIRDFNQDLKDNPWDEELKALASSFGQLLRAVVATIDRHGLKARHLSKHQRDVDAFFADVSGQAFRSEAAEGYRRRLMKYRDKLFTFLRHDGVPWNNNNAEHAVKRFAYYRELADGQFTESGLRDYLVLLSVSATCRYKGVSFLKFLLSREKDIDVFYQNGGRRRPPPAIEVLPEGLISSRRERKPGSGGLPQEEGCSPG